VADDNKPSKGGAKTFTQEDLDTKIEERLKRERAKYADYDELKTKVAELEKANDGKGGDEKLTGQLEKLTQDLAEERNKRLKAEVAAAKGLTPAQAKRLSGTTQEELEADADDLLEAFPTPSKDEATGASRSGPPSPRPKPDLRGGTEPNDDEPVETDPAKLAKDVPRF
jgi:hypothetical protein